MHIVLYTVHFLSYILYTRRFGSLLYLFILTFLYFYFKLVAEFHFEPDPFRVLGCYPILRQFSC
jgi:hypothetical protein